MITLSRVIFGGTSNMYGNKVKFVDLFLKKLEPGREVPRYLIIQCRAHILSPALTCMRNKFPKIKRLFHVLKEIYKLFHQFPKREEHLHKIQVILIK